MKCIKRKYLRVMTLLFIVLTPQKGESQNSNDSENKTDHYSVLIKSVKKPKDSTIVDLIIKHTNKITNSNVKKALDFSKSIVAMSKKINYKNGYYEGLKLLTESHLLLNELDSAYHYIEKMISIGKKNNNKELLMRAYKLKSNYHYYKSEYSKALDFNFLSLEIAEKHFPEEMANNYSGVGLLFRVIGNHEKSKEYYEKAYEAGVTYKDTISLLSYYNNMGIIAKNEKKFQKAIELYETGLDLAKRAKNLLKEGDLVYNLSNVLFEIGNNEEAYKMLDRGIEISEEMGRDSDIAFYHYAFGYRLLSSGEYLKAKSHLESSLSKSKKLNNIEMQINSLTALAEAKAKLNLADEAFNHMKKAYVLKDSIDLSGVNTKAINTIEKLEKEKKAFQDSILDVQRKKEIKHKEQINKEKIRSRDQMIYGMMAIIVLVLIALVLIYKKNKQIKNKNKIINKTNKEVSKQKKIIEEKHTEITDSINYAKRLQDAILPSLEEVKLHFQNSFILFKPKDIVSGDFYWMETTDTHIFLAAADCTGHGVPGAMVSVVCANALNKTVNELGKTDPAEILNVTRDLVIATFAKAGSDVKDGMDISLLSVAHRVRAESESESASQHASLLDNDLHSVSHSVSWAGSNNPLWIIRKGAKEVEEIKANKQPIGLYSESKPFTNHIIKINQGDSIYMFSDGFVDQFGGPDNGKRSKKFKSKNFKNLLLSIQDKSMEEQQLLIDYAFNQWKGDLEQIDDVCIIGVRL